MEREQLINFLCVNIKSRGYIGTAARRYSETIVGMIPSDVLQSKSMLHDEMVDLSIALLMTAKTIR